MEHGNLFKKEILKCELLDVFRDFRGNLKSELNIRVALLKLSHFGHLILLKFTEQSENDFCGFFPGNNLQSWPRDIDQLQQFQIYCCKIKLQCLGYPEVFTACFLVQLQAAGLSNHCDKITTDT